MKENLKLLWMTNLKRVIILRLFLAIAAVGLIVPYGTVNAQGGIAITGKVTDAASGEALLGVNIVVQGTTIGTVSDLSGNYKLTVPNEKSVLVFSFIGYQSMNVTVGSQRQINASLKAEAAALEEVVVVGYGVQKKESVVGAISTATGETIKSGVQGADMTVALTGALPGLAVVRNSGVPGGRDMGRTEGADSDYAYLYIRGQKTWNNSAPLVLVDGVERPLENINPYEIEKISLLKDASATAVFGVKGANGVILITTLRGKEGKPQLTFDGTFTAKTLSRFMHREDSYMANLMKNYAILNEVPVRGTASWNYVVPYQWLMWYKDQTYPEYLPNVDWTDAFTYKWSYDQTANLSISGGTKVVKYFGALSYLHEGDMIALSDIGQGYSPNFLYDKFTFRSNLDFDITPTTRFSANLSGWYSAQKRPDGSKWSGWFGMYSRPPDLYPVRYSDGTWADYQGYSRFTNSLYLFDMYGFQMNKETRLQTDFILNQKLDFITKGLSVNGKVSYDNNFITAGPEVNGFGAITKWIQPQIVDEIQPGMSDADIKALEAKYTLWQFPGTSGSHGFDFVPPPNTYDYESGDNTKVYRRLYYEMSGNYVRDIGKHSLQALGLMSRQEDATGSAFVSYREDWVGRFTYNFDRRYFIELNGAYNGSEKFSSKYRFGFFPSMAAGWTVSNESFFESLRSVVSNLKFRYSDGKIGSDAGIARWLYVPSWIVKNNTTSTSSQDVWRFGAPYIENAYPLRYEGVIANPDIQWETAHKRDFGVETGFFNNMLRLNFDYFWEDRTGIFMSGSDITIPEYFGKPPVSQNLGEVTSHGWEFEGNFSKTFANGLNIWVNHTWAFAKDKIIERNDPPFKPEYQMQKGFQIGQPRNTLNQNVYPLLTWNDIYNTVWGTSNTNALPGDYARVDYNSDGVIDSNDAIPWGYPTRPQFNYAPSIGANWKNFSVSARFYGVYNIEGGIASYMGNFAETYSVVYPYVRTHSWSPEFGLLQDATNAGLRFTSSGTSGYFDRSRSYFRFQHAEVGYTLNAQFLRKVGLSNLRFIVSGDNIALWSDMYEDLDAPQITTEGNVRRQYPTTRRVNFGLSFNFQ